MWWCMIGYSRLVQFPLFYQIQLSWDHAWIKLCWALTFIQVQKAPHKLFLTWRFPPPGLDHCHDPWLQITVTDWWVQRIFGLLTPLFHAWILWVFFVACCDMLEPICLFSSKQNDKRNIGNIAQISKIVYYHLVLLICWHLQLINKWKMVRTLKLTWSLWEA